MKKNIVSRKRMNIDLGGTAVNDIKIIGVSEVNFSFTLPLLCFLYIYTISFSRSFNFPDHVELFKSM